MCAGGCTRLLGLIFLLVASLALTIHFIAPYLTNKIGLYSEGYWGRCYGEVDLEDVGGSFDGCTWFSDRDFEFMENLPGWWYACQGLSAFGMVFLLLAVPAGCGSLCCCKSDRLAYFTGSATSFACLLLAISVSVWGWGMYDKHGIVPFKDQWDGKADWGYYIGIAGVILGWIASGLFFCSRTKYRY